MSYTRWPDSRWYTYWTGDSIKIQTELLEICGVTSFTFTELRTRPQECLEKAVCIVEEISGTEVDEDDCAELLGVFNQFIKHMKRHYSEKHKR